MLRTCYVIGRNADSTFADASAADGRGVRNAGGTAASCVVSVVRSAGYATGFGRRNGEPACSGLARDRRARIVFRLAEAEPQTDHSRRRSKPASPGLCSDRQAADAHPGLSLGTRATVGPVAAGF